MLESFDIRTKLLGLLRVLFRLVWLELETSLFSFLFWKIEVFNFKVRAIPALLSFLFLGDHLLELYIFVHHE